MSPKRAARPCSYPGCPELVIGAGSRCRVHAEVYHSQPYRVWYRTDRWRQIRAAQLLAEPWCVECRRLGGMVQATDVDHIERHNGDEVKFFAGPFQSLCHSHHSSKTRREIIGGV